MPSADIKGDAGSARQKKEPGNPELEKLQKTIDVQSTELSSYKRELTQVLDRIAELENKLVMIEQEMPEETQTPSSPEEFIEGEAKLLQLKLTPVDFSRPSIAIPHDRPFKLCLSINLPRPKSRDAHPLPWRLSVFAKQLAGGSTRIVGETDASAGESDDIHACMMGYALQTGTYRIEVQASTHLPGNEEPYITRIEDGLINVY